MADFTLNAPGTTNSPWLPAGIITVNDTIKSDATGFRASTAGVFGAFAHNVTYGSVIEATIKIAAGATSNGDDVVVGAVVRSGANAGAVIGVYVGLANLTVVTETIGGSRVNISSGVTITRATNDVIDVTVTIVGGTATVTCKYNTVTQTFDANTTTTFASEASLAAGCQDVPGNVNALYYSQFTGTGVVAAPTFNPTPNMGIFLGSY